MNELTEEQKQLIQFWVTEIEEYMPVNDFQREFFISLCAQYDEKDWLSLKQRESLQKIYERVTE